MASQNTTVNVASAGSTSVSVSVQGQTHVSTVLEGGTVVTTTVDGEVSVPVTLAGGTQITVTPPTIVIVSVDPPGEISVNVVVGSAQASASNAITGLTGDVTASGPGDVPATLAASGVVAGSYTNLNATIDDKGRVTSAANGSAGSGITELTGDGTAGPGSGSQALTLTTVNSNVGSFGSATKASVMTVNAKGLVTAASESTVTPAVSSITGLGTNVATALGNVVNGASGIVVLDGTSKLPAVDGSQLTNLPSGSGDVIGPATNTDLFVPQWNGTNSKTLKNGFATSTGGSTSDAGKLAVFGTNGVLACKNQLSVSGASNSTLVEGSQIHFVQSGGTGTLEPLGNTGTRSWAFQNASGTLAFLGDIPTKAWVVFDGTTGTTSANVTGTWSRSGTTATITVTGHSHVVGNVVYANFTSGGATSGKYTVATVVDANSFTITVPAAGTSGNVTLLRKPILASSPSVTSVTYLNSAGTFTVNFASGIFSDANYDAAAGSATVSGVSGFCIANGTVARTANACDVVTIAITAIGTAATANPAGISFHR